MTCNDYYAVADGQPNQSDRPSICSVHTGYIQYLNYLIGDLYQNFARDPQASTVDGATNGRKSTRMTSKINDSLTTLIETGPSTTNVHRTVYYPEDFVVLHWQWRLHSGALVPFSTVHFALTIGENWARNGKLPLWKSNVLPLPLDVLDCLDDTFNLRQKSSVNVAAKSTNVRLMNDEDEVGNFVTMKDTSGNSVVRSRNTDNNKSSKTKLLLQTTCCTE
ncbi:hypothetical protein B0J12DRAFT_761626 [Macrophomina phaseolina]|uniref:Uncharacterized protein n=1 Tax=Macrophomina phaseolina TaxID=35725 RepID=A0ABQ8G221_9PEZI|nr:hypothetical protein B0J12DRAFT_761626 [Macrophomina phaseolina]